MIEVRFFASVRESLGVEAMQVMTEGLTTVADVLRTLRTSGGEGFSEVLGVENLLVAVNQVMVKPDHVVADGDEVAFSPPVTGG